MRITSKGQVTIPQEIREALGLLPLTEVVFEIDGDAVRITRSATRKDNDRGSRMVGALAGTATAGLSTEAIMELTRGE